MLDNIQLFSKSFNLVEKPNLNWTEKTTIHCSFELNLGFASKKIIYDFNDSIKLIHIINYYKGLHNFITQSSETNFKYELKNIEFVWSKSDNGIEVTLSKVLHNTKAKLLKYFPFSLTDLYKFKNDFLIEILALLSETNNDVRSKIGELIYDYNNTEYEYQIGQRVKTIINKNVKTERIGLIIDKWYHMKDKTNMYQIIESENKNKKRYLPNDIKLID